MLKVNSAFTHITNFSKDEVVGKRLRPVLMNTSDDTFDAELSMAMYAYNCWQGEVLSTYKNGHTYTEWLNIMAIRNDVNEITRYVCTFSDITHHRGTDSQIYFMAFYDPLTKLPNRTMLYDRLKYCTVRLKRSGNYNALMVLDLDKFKAINDSLGHGVGDDLLIEVAQRLTECVREEDVVARIGGDEFIILIQDLDQDLESAEQKASMVAEKVCERLRETISINDYNLHIGASIGITVFQNFDDPNLIKNADYAMYWAKNSGRNTFCFFSEAMSEQIQNDLIVEQELRCAIRDEQFELYYQPQLDIKTNEVIGVEALLRWNHPIRGIVLPKEFMEVAEQTKLIVTIDNWVLSTACLRIAKLRKIKTVHYISVNVSPLQFQQHNFIEIVEDCILKADIDANQLELELTECFFQNSTCCPEKVLELKALGVRIAIDDFGTCYSSLHDLKRASPDLLKIDQSFIGDSSEPLDASVTKAIIALASSLKLNVLAEGVETPKQLEFLKQVGCDMYQGNLYSAPVTFKMLVTMLKNEYAY